MLRPHARLAAVTHRLAATLRCRTRRGLTGRRTPEAESGLRRPATARGIYIYTGADPCPSPASSASRALRRFVGMGQALVGHAGSVGAGRHGHCPRVMAWLAPPHASQQTRVGSRARSTLLTQHGRRLPLRGP